MTVLENLYNGNINFADKSIKRGSEYDRLAQVSSELEDKLRESISKQEKQIYEELFEIRFQQEDIMLTETFVEGFRLGAQIMLEIFSEPKRQLVPISENE